MVFSGQGLHCPGTNHCMYIFLLSINVTLANSKHILLSVYKYVEKNNNDFIGMMEYPTLATINK